MSRCLVCLILLNVSAAGAFAKTGNSYYTDDEIAAIRARAKLPEYAAALKAVKESADLIANRSDEEIWALVPEASQLRAINVHFSSDCPVHGSAVHQAAGHYPWKMSPDKLFKLECPIGHEVYPSNDFEAYLKSGKKEKLDTTQPYVDDGNGWVNEKGERYYFVGHYMFWELWRHIILDGATACGKYYLATGDAKYAHKAAVMLARISQVYPAMNYNSQAYHYGRFPSKVNGRILDYIWENSTVSNFALTYDAIFESLEADSELKSFAASKGVGDVMTAIERDLLQVGVKDIFEKKIWGNKFELGSLSTIALVLQNDDPARGATTKQMTDWILTGPGDLEFTFWNGFDRDGIGGESSPAYSTIWNTTSIAAADNLARLGANIVNDRRWLRLATGPSQMRILDTLGAHIGDTSGTAYGTNRIVTPSLLKFAVRHFEDPYSAKLLLDQKQTVELFERDEISNDRLTAFAAKNAFPDAPYTRDLGGYGLAILELDDGAHARSASFYYGSPGSSHGHADRLNLSYSLNKTVKPPTTAPAAFTAPAVIAASKMNADERTVLPDLGYPSSWTDSSKYWTKNTTSHYCVLVDEQPQLSLNSGHLTMFADLDGLKLAEAQGKSVWTPLKGDKSAGNPLESTTAPATKPAPVDATSDVSDYRRMTALLDTGEKSTLLIDAFVVKGGRQHDYSFHGLPFGMFSIDGASLQKRQETGTLAGEAIEYAERPDAKRAESGYQFLMKPAFYEPGEVTHLAWEDDAGLDLHAYFPSVGMKQVIACDAVPPLSPGFPDTMKYVLFRNQSESDGGPLETLFLSVLTCEAQGASPIASVQRIIANSPMAGGMRIELKSGAAWTIYVNASGVDARMGDATSSVPCVALRHEGGALTKTYAAGEGKFELGSSQFAVAAEPAGRITSVDYRAGAVVVDAIPVFDVGERGRVVRASSLENNASYTVRSISPDADGRATLSFGDTPLLTGRFRASYDAKLGKLQAHERTGGVYNQFVAKSFVGMFAISEDLKTSAVITGYDQAANIFTLDASPEKLAQFKDHDGNGHSHMYLADLGAGIVLQTTPFRITP